MKRVTLILAVLMATNLAIGQTDYDVLPYFSAGDYEVEVTENVMQMRDGNILVGIALFDVNNWHIPGWCFLKVSIDCAEVLDTTIIEDHTLTDRALLEPDPDGEGYLFATIRTDEILSKNYLSICRFNEDLDFDVANEIKIPLEDSVSLGYEYFYLDDNDIILYYPIIGPDNVFVLSRFGLNGSLKHRQVIADSLCPINEPFGKIKVWNESLKKYVVNGRQHIAPIVHSHYCVLDSLFDVDEVIPYGDYPLYGNVVLLTSEFDDFENLDDSTYIFTTTYQIGTTLHGVQVTRRDKITHENLKTSFFPYNDPTGLSNNDQIIGIRKSSDDNVYIAYFNNGIIITKMDTELNVIWQRRCHSSIQNEFSYIPVAFAKSMCALDNGGLAIGGNYMWDESGVFILTLSAEGTSTPEMERFLRPYMFYPNPAQDQLHLQYSPDVTPARIELYDLHGRLVRIQSKGLENVDLQGLTAGQYLMKVTMMDGMVYTDKVVKE